MTKVVKRWFNDLGCVIMNKKLHQKMNLLANAFKTEKNQNSEQVLHENLQGAKVFQTYIYDDGDE